MESKTLPIAVSPCPIVESTIEIRCEFSVPIQTIAGIIYGQFQDEKISLTPLSVLQIPEEIRLQDPNLKYKPFYRINFHNISISDTEEGSIQFGSDVIMISSPAKYPSWTEFETFIKRCLDKIFSAKIIKEIQYISLRYVNFFQCNIFDKISLDITLNNTPILQPSTVFKTEIHEPSLIHVLQIANNVHLKNNEIDSDGSIIEIVSVLKPDKVNKETLYDDIVLLHKREKNMFFSLLKQDYIATLNPKYPD